MTFEALGMIETIGLPTAIAAADAATKAANIQLMGYDLASGGLVTVKLRGDVGAVQAAVRAGAQLGTQVGQVVSTHVIPRPHSDLQPLTAQLVRGPTAAPPTPEPALGKSRRPRKTKAAPLPQPVVEAEKTVTEPAAAVEIFIPAVDPPLPVVVAQEVIIDEAGHMTFGEEIAAVADTDAVFGAEIVADAANTAGVEVCNLCGDPACPRRKGQPHRLCMHWES